MRSSKQRSRSKQNRNRSVGNIVNRVFDSSGPEGKVRGTPQQIIEKYNQLARDAQLSGDRVATENFQQHAEHYTRMLAEATKEQDQRREQHEQQQRERQQHRQSDRGGNGGGGGQQGGQQGGGNAPHSDPSQAPQPSLEQPAAPVEAVKPEPAAVDPSEAPQPDMAVTPKKKPKTGPVDVIDAVDEADTGLVETPESKPAPKRRGRPRKKPVEPKAEAAVPKAEAAEPKAEAAEPKAETAEPKAEAAKPKAEAAKPKAEAAKPKAEPKAEAPAKSGGPAEAAE